MAWEEESINIDPGEPSGNKRNLIKLALIGVGGLVVLVGLYFLISFLFFSPSEKEPEKKPAEVKTAAPPVAQEEAPLEEGEGVRIDLERFVVRLDGGQNGGYLVFDASIWVTGETQREALGGSEPDDALTVKVRQILFSGIASLTVERARDAQELRELGAQLKPRLEAALGANSVSLVRVSAREL